MDLLDIFRNRAQHLYWRRLGGDRVEGGHDEALIEDNQAYFVIRLKEMYLSHTRKLWRRFYPVLHGYVKYGDKEDHSVAGPGQLRELGEVNLDRAVILNYRLAGPVAYRGGDVTLLVGLYSVPGQDATRALIDTVGTVANLAGVALGPALPIANVVKAGIESILSLGETTLQLGVNDTFYPGNRLRAGFYLGINAPAAEIDATRLWLKEGRLVKGRDPIAALPYEDHDYMVLEVERRDKREDWPRLPGIAEFQDKFAAVMRDAGLGVPQKRAQLAQLWPQFQQALNDSPHLTQPDREQIALSVAQDLKGRLQAQESGNPFETRSWGERTVGRKSPDDFDLVDVPDYLDRKSEPSLRMAQAALTANPFQT